MFLGHPKRLLLCIGIWSFLSFASQLIYNFLPRLWIKTIMILSGSANRSSFQFKKSSDECLSFVSFLIQLGFRRIKIDDATIQLLFATYSSDLIILFTCIILYYRYIFKLSLLLLLHIYVYILYRFNFLKK